jgi:(p)ppGpp synthase/HD superfamily hydrolase
MSYSLTDRAKKFAAEKHAGQFRRATGEPYITHPEAVEKLLAEYKSSHHIDELCAAAYLHDTLEDTDATIEELDREFGSLVASLVYELTNDAAVRAGFEDKEAYMNAKLLFMTPYALDIKLCDILANLIDSPTSSQRQWLRHRYEFLFGNGQLPRKLTATQIRILDRIGRELELV